MFAQALVGDVHREAGISRVTETGTSAWREVLDFGEKFNFAVQVLVAPRVNE